MAKPAEEPNVVRQHHEQMLKLVAKGFYNELINYGVNKAEVLAVAGHLLDNVMQKTGPANKEGEYYNRVFTLKDVRDEWAAARRLAVHQVSLTPLAPEQTPLVAGWLRAAEIREGFYPPFPEGEAELADYFSAAGREYFCIWHERQPVGVMGAENLDAPASRLEMRKLVGDPDMHGKGIGKRATFLFLYHSFVIRKFNKVYLHSMDINIRNLNLNSRFGFELEGVFLEDAVVRGKRHDVVRMGLLGPVWLALFA
jgi:RimJ/RimL family protein N-acetyltransferase